MLAISMDIGRIFAPGETVTIAAKAFGDAWAKEHFGAGWVSARVGGKISRKANVAATLYLIKVEGDRVLRKCKREDLLPGPWCAASSSNMDGFDQRDHVRKG